MQSVAFEGFAKRVWGNILNLNYLNILNNDLFKCT